MSTCKGLMFKCVVNIYFDKGKSHLVERKIMRLLKRRSCSGCGECDWMLEDLNESVLCDTYPDLSKCLHNRLYSLRVINVSTDWELGIVDSYDFDFKLYKELTLPIKLNF